MTDNHLNREDAGIEAILTCPLCESGLLATRQCKRICERCGYIESCEDSFIPIQDNPPSVAQPPP